MDTLNTKKLLNERFKSIGFLATTSTATLTTGAKNSNRSLYRFFLLIFTFMLLIGCDLSYQSKFKGALQIEQAFIDRNVPAEKSQVDWLNDLQFLPYLPDEIINFSQQNQDLLLKIQVTNVTDETSGFTLSLFPKHLESVSYSNHSSETGYSDVLTQFRNKTDENRYYSSQRFAFNIDQKNISYTHFLLLHSATNSYVQIDLIDSHSYLKSDRSFSHFFTLVYGIILAMVLFNAACYLFTRDHPYLWYTLFIASSLYSMLWQENKINDVPWLAWHLMGTHSGIIYFIVADALATLFFYKFLRLDWHKSWLVKLILLTVLLRLGAMVTALVQYHVYDALQYGSLINTVGFSAAISVVLVWLILLRRTFQGFPQAKYLFTAWSIYVFTFVMWLYFTLYPHPELIWMPHSHEISLMFVSLIIAFALVNRAMKPKSPSDKIVNKHAVAEHSVQKHQLVSQFQEDMQALVKDPTMSEDEFIEKTNIKFHLLINKAFPIKNSMIHVDDQLAVICSTGLQASDIDLLNFKLNHLSTSISQDQASQFEINTSNNQQISFLYLPLNSTVAENTRFILGLKNNQPVNPGLLDKFRVYCEAAYTALKEARELHQVALAANLDNMTGTHNRGSIEKIIKESLKHASRTTLALLDLDDLKSVNEQYGHAIGDQCIIEFTARLSAATKDTAKLGRIGGDQFIAAFSDIEFELCEELFEAFMASLVDTTFTKEKLTITSSVGLAESRINETKKSLLTKAEAAMVYSKKQGKNQLTVFSMDLTD